MGVFGGSFNPPHVAHLAVAEAVADAAGLDRVLWIPAATPPHKRGDPSLASAADRLAMVCLATAGNPRFEVSDVEIARAGVSYTADTLDVLAAADPEADLALILGGDSLAGLPTWRDPERILARARVLAYARPGAPREAPASPGLAERLAWVEAPALALSSTDLRARLAAGRSVRYLVPDAVRAYIAANGLYGALAIPPPSGA